MLIVPVEQRRDGPACVGSGLGIGAGGELAKCRERLGYERQPHHRLAACQSAEEAWGCLGGGESVSALDQRREHAPCEHGIARCGRRGHELTQRLRGGGRRAIALGVANRSGQSRNECGGSQRLVSHRLAVSGAALVL
eukprot:scaffold465_cov120-Isochrysis_galbana.AAC.2